MKRRNFLASIAGIFAAPFVAKKAVADPLAEITSEQWAWKARAESIHTGKGNRMWQEWTNDGRMIEHNEHPGTRHDSFVVEVFQDWHPIKLSDRIH